MGKKCNVEKLNYKFFMLFINFTWAAHRLAKALKKTQKINFIIYMYILPMKIEESDFTYRAYIIFKMIYYLKKVHTWS